MNTERWRVAWLFPSLELGNYWHPVFSEFSKIYQQTIIYTGVWRGFSPGFEAAFQVKVVGEMRFVDTTQSSTGYSQGFIYASPAIVGELLKFKPNLIFTTGFCIWTLFALLLKPLGRWQVVIAYEGSAPGVDYRNSPARLRLRRWMSSLSDGFITNSHAGKTYLNQVLGVDEHRIFAKPYEVPDVQALLKHAKQREAEHSTNRHPVFLFTGQLIARKGLQRLLEACTLLREQGYHDYTLLVAGDGEQRETLQAYCTAEKLTDRVCWLGWVSYAELGAYFHQADVFILPTLEDTWGMVILESMAFGKPVLCSRWAGASELVIDGDNGYLFDPHEPEAIAVAMRRFLDQPELIAKMGQRSREQISEHTPSAAAQFLANVTHTVLEAAGL